MSFSFSIWRVTQTAAPWRDLGPFSGVLFFLFNCYLGHLPATMPFSNNFTRFIGNDATHTKSDKSLRSLRRRSSSHDSIRSKYLNSEKAVLKPRNGSHYHELLRRLASSYEEDKENEVVSIPSNVIIPPLAAKGKRNVTISIEGNIGCGKTTLLNYLAKRDDVQVNVEPVDDWKNCRGHNLLGLMYKDPVRWAFTFQSYVQLTMLNQHIQPHTRPIKLLERSLQSARYCFVENMALNNRIADAEYTVLDEWFKWLLVNSDVHLDQIVYLRSSPEVCYERIKQRCRKEEEGIPLEYLQEIHDRYEEWLIKKTKFSIPAPIIVLDAEKCLPDMIKLFEEKQQTILLKSAIN